MDSVIKRLDTKNWISSYEVFVQKIEMVNGNLDFEQNFNFKIRDRIGIAIRTISKSYRMKELSISSQRFYQDIDLTPPKSTNLQVPNLYFPELKEPRISSIQGDRAKATNLSVELVNETLESTAMDSNTAEIPMNQNLIVIREHRLITNTGSRIQNDESLKVQYGVNTKFKLNNNHYSINRTDTGRTIDLNYSDVIKELHNAVETQSKPSVNFDPKVVSVVFHPEVLGKILSNFVTLRLTNPNQTTDNPIFAENLNLYDDPLRDSGYNSCIFDDEGTLTKPIRIIENGVHTGGLYDIVSSGWKNRGNGYRNSWYHPMTRSFEFPVDSHISNLVLVGGTGKGNRFIERPGLTLQITRGNGVLTGLEDESSFIIHANEAELYKNGILQGPTDKITILTSLHEILSEGQMSSDNYGVVDRAIPGSVYLGWVSVAPGITKIR